MELNKLQDLLIPASRPIPKVRNTWRNCRHCWNWRHVLFLQFLKCLQFLRKWRIESIEGIAHSSDSCNSFIGGEWREQRNWRPRQLPQILKCLTPSNPRIPTKMIESKGVRCIPTNSNSLRICWHPPPSPPPPQQPPPPRRCSLPLQPPSLSGRPAWTLAYAGHRGWYRGGGLGGGGGRGGHKKKHGYDEIYVLRRILPRIQMDRSKDKWIDGWIEKK